MMGVSKEDLEKAIRCYEGYGLVTRKMMPNLNCRPWSRELYAALQESGCADADNALPMELVINDYEDYYGVVYNSLLFKSEDEVKKYVLKYNW